MMGAIVKQYGWIGLVTACCCAFFYIPMLRWEWMSASQSVLHQYAFLLLSLVTTLLVFLIPKKNNNPLSINVLDILVIGYYVYVVVLFVAPYPYLWRSSKIFLFSTSVLVYISVRRFSSILSREYIQKSLSFLVLAFLISVVIQGSEASLQLYGVIESQDPNFNLSGSFSLVSFLAMYLGIGFPIALHVLFQANDDQWLGQVSKYLAYMSLILIAFLLPYTGNRSSWLVVCFSTAYLVYHTYRQTIIDFIKVGQRRIWMSSIALGILIIGAYSLYQFKQGSADGRVIIWKVLVQKISESPWSGHGFDSIALNYGKWQSIWFQTGNGSEKEQLLADQVHVAYNEWIGSWVETGIVGLIFWMAIFWVLVRYRKDYRDETKKQVWVSICMATAVYMLFSYPFVEGLIQVLFFMSLGFLSSQIHSLKWELHLNKIVRYATVVTLCVILSFYTHYIYRQKAFYDDLSFGITLKETRSFEDAIPYYERAFSQMKHDLNFVVSFSELYQMAGMNQNSVDLLEDYLELGADRALYINLGNSYQKLKDYDKAEDAFMQAYYIAPSRFLPLYMILKMHQVAGNRDRTLEVARWILDKKVKVDSEAVREIKNEARVAIERLIDRPEDA